MQFRAGLLYIALFAVVAAGAYGVIGAAESPEVTVDPADADYQLEPGQEFQLNDRTYNATDVGADSGSIEYVNESAILQTEWSDGDTVELEDGTEYDVMVQAGNESDGGNETDAGNETDGGNETDAGNDSVSSFVLIESFSEDEYETLERDGEQYVVVSEGGDEVLVPLLEFDELETQTYELGDTIAYNDSDAGQMIEGNITDISSDTVTIEYVGEESTTYDLTDGEVATIGQQEFGVDFPEEGTVYLTSDVESFEAQQEEVTYFNERIRGLWWVIAIAVTTIVLLAALAYMPVRG